MRTWNLKAERGRHGWGQVEAAQRLGVSQPYLAMLENGRRRVTPALARGWFRLMDCRRQNFLCPQPSIHSIK